MNNLSYGGTASIIPPATTALWYDLTPNNRNGEDHTGGGWPSFDGVGDYVVAPGPYVPPGGGPGTMPIDANLQTATLEVWIKAAGLALNSRPLMVNSESTVVYLAIAIIADGEIRAMVGDAYRAGSAVGLITVGPWAHVVVTVGSGIAPTIFLNGVDVTTGPVSVAYPQSDSQICVGAQLYNPGPPPTTTQRFNGDIDTARVYDRILSPDEVLNNFNAGKAAHP